jgi:hypothetical protein
LKTKKKQIFFYHELAWSSGGGRGEGGGGQGELLHPGQPKIVCF